MIRTAKRQSEEHLTGSSGLSLRTNFAWSFAGNVVYMAAQWAMLAVLAKLGSPEMVGQFALSLAITAPIVLFANLSLRAILVTDARRSYHFGDYLSLRLATTLGAIIVVVAVAIFAGFNRETALVIIAMGVAKGFEAISDIYHALLQQNEHMERIAWSKFIKGPLSLLALAICVYFTSSVLVGILGMAGIWLIVLLAYDKRSVQWLQNRLKETIPASLNWQRTVLSSLIRLAFPLGLTALLISLNTNIPRYYIERYLGGYSLGIFAAMAYLLVAGDAIIGALGQTASPRLARYYATADKKAFRRLLAILLLIAVSLGAAGFLLAFVFGEDLLTIFYGMEYAQHVDVLLWLCAAATVSFIAAFLGYGMTAAHYFRIQPFIFALVTVISFVSGLFLIPAYGLVGAAWTLLIAALVQALAAFMVNMHALRHIPALEAVP